MSTPISSLVATVALTAVLTAGAPAAHGQSSAPRDNPIVNATVTSFEVTPPGANGWRYLMAAVHIHNLSKQRLTLGVENAKVSSTDDRGNTFAVTMVRGIGEIAGSRLDPAFALPANGGGDTLFQMRWRGEKGVIFGTIFDFKMPIRVIVPLEAGQHKLGAEHLLSFTGLQSGHKAVPKGVATTENTVDAGPFTVEITRFTPSIAGNRRSQSVALAARIKNTSNKPITLAYESGSSFGVDDQGNLFAANDAALSGIGVATSQKADPQLVLAPGESRDIQFSVWRRLGREVAGKTLTCYVAFSELEVLPANQIRTTRQYSLTYPRLAGLN